MANYPPQDVLYFQSAGVPACRESVTAEDGLLNPAVLGQAEFEAEFIAYARLGPE